MKFSSITDIKKSFLYFFVICHVRNENIYFHLPIEIIKIIQLYCKVTLYEKYAWKDDARIYNKFIQVFKQLDHRTLWRINHSLTQWPIKWYEVDNIFHGPCEVRTAKKHIAIKAMFNNGEFDGILEVRNSLGEFLFHVKFTEGVIDGPFETKQDGLFETIEGIKWYKRIVPSHHRL